MCLFRAQVDDLKKEIQRIEANTETKIAAYEKEAHENRVKLTLYFCLQSLLVEGKLWPSITTFSSSEICNWSNVIIGQLAAKEAKRRMKEAKMEAAKAGQKWVKINTVNFDREISIVLMSWMDNRYWYISIIIDIVDICHSSSDHQFLT